MKSNNKELSVSRINRIREQGYFNLSNQEITKIAIGNRFAYQLCTAFLLIAVPLGSVPILSVLMCFAFLSVILPNHPFDYIYNYLISGLLKLPRLPKRAVQLKFACGIATIWLAVTIHFFIRDLNIQGYIVGGIFIGMALLLSITDLCIPSKIYNQISNNIKNNNQFKY